jgi:two-component system response regulator FixJ
MSAKNIVCVVSQDASLSNSLKGPFKSAGLSLTSQRNVYDFIEALDPDKPVACVISELNGGVDLVKELAEAHCVVPVVLLAGSGSLTTAVQAIKAGAFDVAEKNDALVESAKKAVGFFAKCQKLMEEKAIAAERIDSLTRRESQVLKLMVSGMPNRKIAEELGISPKTLDIHRANLMDKMEARTTADMCRAYLLHTTHPMHLQLFA